MKTWFKFYGQEYLSDPKMLSLDPTERAIWLTILCLASSSHEEGVIRYISLQKILQLTNVEYGGFYEKILDRFSDLGMITVDNEKDNLVIKVVNYEKRQQKTLTPYERVKNYRERQKISKKIASNDNEMITHDNADDNDRIEKNRIEKKRNDLPTEDLKEKKVKASPSLAKSLKEKYPNVFKAIILLFAFLLLPHLTFAKTVEVEYQVTIRGYQSPQAHASGTRAVGGTAPSSSPVRKKTTVPHGSQIEELIKSYFGSEADVAIAVARAESGLRPDAVGDGAIAYWQDGVEYGKSYGLFQIRHLPGRPDPQILLDPVRNVEYAYALYKRSGFYPWSAFTNGAYLNHL